MQIKVCCALIIRGREVLMAQKKQKGPFANMWEFPGGKIEDNESPHQAIIREIQEELACTIVPEDIPLCETHHDYAEKKIHFFSFIAKISNSEPRALEHQQLKWVEISQLLSYDLVPADIAIAKILMAHRSGPPL